MANEDKCTNAQKPSAQHSELQRATSILIAVLMRQAEAPLRVLEACQVAANEDKCTNAQKPSAQHSEIQRAASILIAALMRQAAAPLRVLEACQEDARFSHLKERFSHLKERFSHLKVTEKIRRALDDQPQLRPSWRVLRLRMLPPPPRLCLLLDPHAIFVGETDPSGEGLGAGEIGEEREIRAPYNVTTALSWGMVG